MNVLLFDADGVLTLPKEFFTQVYANSRGLDLKPFDKFFKEQWSDIVTGRKDLKVSIAENPDLWKWDGTVDELVQYWCEIEDVRNREMLELIKKLKENGVPIYLATDQEIFRGEYMKNVMFKGLFYKHYISSEIGHTKNDREFFEFVFEDLKLTHPELVASDVVFFDDTQSKVDVAKAYGLDARLFENAKQVKAFL